MKKRMAMLALTALMLTMASNGTASMVHAEDEAKENSTAEVPGAD